ncbi:hypothetical protein HanPI659440_Chr14g0566931 [Helianthus annuus]|nr:hypothetical protein HanPI659440_Chr14g0566931 [Helianthus annuus]
MMYKSFKHQKTSLSIYTLLLKNTRDTLGFHIHFKIFQIARFPAPPSLSLSLSLSIPDLDLGFFSEAIQDLAFLINSRSINKVEDGDGGVGLKMNDDRERG